MTIRVALIDADQVALLGLERLLAHEPDVAVVARLDADGAPTQLEQSAADAVFVDAELAHLAVPCGHPPRGLVYTSTGDAAARRAFDAGAVDYLTKPFRPERVAEAVRRLRERLRPAPFAAALGHVNALLRELGGPRERRDRSQRPLLIRQDDRSILLRLDQVDWLEADGKRVNVYSGKQVFSIRDSLTRLETVLDRHRFIRIHRSRIVQLNRVCELRPLKYGDYEALLRNGTRLCISRVYADRLADLLAAAV